MTLNDVIEEISGTIGTGTTPTFVSACISAANKAVRTLNYRFNVAYSLFTSGEEELEYTERQTNAFTTWVEYYLSQVNYMNEEALASKEQAEEETGRAILPES